MTVKKEFLDRMYERRREAQEGRDRASAVVARMGNREQCRLAQATLDGWNTLLACVERTIHDYLEIHSR